MTRKKFKKMIMSARYSRDFANNLIETLHKEFPKKSYFELFVMIYNGDIYIQGISNMKTEVVNGTNGAVKVTYLDLQVNIDLVIMHRLSRIFCSINA